MAPLSPENELIYWLRREARGAGGEAIGDDAAFIPAGGPWALTVDTQIEGVHFLPGLPPQRLARRLLAVNLSDLAAVGARPAWALLALAAPPGYPHRDFFRALLAECRRWDLRLVGGDLANSHQLTAVLTLAGGLSPGKRWVRRSDARAGDQLWVGGALGESALGRLLLARGARWEAGGGEECIHLPAELSLPHHLAAAARGAVRRHLEPQPQLELGEWLASQERAAALDISDGLTLDLARLCRESSREATGTLGARLDARALAPTAERAELAHCLGNDALSLSLSGGEDYVLLFALPPGGEPPATLRAQGCRRIGEITAPGAVGEDVVLELEDGAESMRISPRGWDHLEGN